jgi:hypothetical protein
MKKIVLVVLVGIMFLSLTSSAQTCCYPVVKCSDPEVKILINDEEIPQGGIAYVYQNREVKISILAKDPDQCGPCSGCPKNEGITKIWLEIYQTGREIYYDDYLDLNNPVYSFFPKNPGRITVLGYVIDDDCCNNKKEEFLIILNVVACQPSPLPRTKPREEIRCKKGIFTIGSSYRDRLPSVAEFSAGLRFTSHHFLDFSTELSAAMVAREPMLGGTIAVKKELCFGNLGLSFEALCLTGPYDITATPPCHYYEQIKLRLLLPTLSSCNITFVPYLGTQTLCHYSKSLNYLRGIEFSAGFDLLFCNQACSGQGWVQVAKGLLKRACCPVTTAPIVEFGLSLAF